MPSAIAPLTPGGGGGERRRRGRGSRLVGNRREATDAASPCSARLLN
jgi:hypothetical protein